MIDDVLLRRPYDPDWTEREYTDAGGRDHLGIETLSEAILADLLPGINNQTRRARYYSFWAWMLRDFIRDPRATHTQAGFYEWLRPREAALVLGCLAHGCGIGIAGTEQGSKEWGDGLKRAYSLQWKSLRSVNGGSYELYYRGALEEMNIIARLEGSLHDDLTNTVGLSLADAYGEAVSCTRYVRQHLRATRLGRPELEDFAARGCLCRLHDHQKERRRLINAFFRFNSPDALAVKRLASLCFFLDVVDQSRGQPLTELDMRAVLYFWSFGSHHAYRPEGNCLEPAQRWRIFQLRQYFVFAIETLWALFLQRIQGQEVSDEEYLGWLLAELDLGALAERFGLVLPKVDPQVLTLEGFYRAVREALPARAFKPGRAALATPLNERDLAHAILREPSPLDVQVWAGNALLMFALMYWRCQPWRSDPGWVYVSDHFAGTGRMSMDSYLRQTERAFAESWTLARWLGWFHQRNIWLQHRRVVLEKLVYRQQDTACFEVIDDCPPDVRVGHTGRSMLFRGVAPDEPKMNAPRFPSALSILGDLGLIARLPNSGYRLMAEGKKLLARYRTYTVPEWTEPEDDQATDEPEEAAG